MPRGGKCTAATNSNVLHTVRPVAEEKHSKLKAKKTRKTARERKMKEEAIRIARCALADAIKAAEERENCTAECSKAVPAPPSAKGKEK